MLSCVAQAGAHVGVTELAQRAKLDKTTTYRLANKLVGLGYLERDAAGRFGLGLRVLDLGFAYLASLDLRTHALPELRRLREALDGTISLAVLDGVEIVYIERFASKRLQASMPVGVGARLPAYCTAMGKAMLAFLPPHALAALLERMPLTAWTPRTIVSREALERDLAGVRERGYATTDQETIDGLRALGVPIFDHARIPVASISIAVSVHAATLDELVATAAPELRRAAAAISSRLGAGDVSMNETSVQ